MSHTSLGIPSYEYEKAKEAMRAHDSHKRAFSSRAESAEKTLEIVYDFLSPTFESINQSAGLMGFSPSSYRSRLQRYILENCNETAIRALLKYANIYGDKAPKDIIEKAERFADHFKPRPDRTSVMEVLAEIAAREDITREIKEAAKVVRRHFETGEALTTIIKRRKHLGVPRVMKGIKEGIPTVVSRETNGFIRKELGLTPS